MTATTGPGACEPPAALGRIRSAYNSIADRYEERLPRATRARLRFLDAALVRHVSGARTVLELGAANGRLIEQVEAPFRLALDVAERMCVHAARRVEVALQADMSALPLRDQSFEAVLSGWGAGRYVSPEALLPEMARVLVDHGRFGLHLFVAASSRPWSRLRAALGSPRTGSRQTAPFDLTGWHDSQAMFSKHGLVIQRAVPVVSSTARPYFRLLPSPILLTLASQVVLLGVRRSRQFQRAIDRTLATLASGRAVDIRVVGGSMAPTIERGTAVTVVPCDRAAAGDVVLIVGGDSMMVHRVRARVGPWYIHQGDLMGALPARCAAWQVVGKVLV